MVRSRGGDGGKRKVEKKVRNSNIELLRIISMVLIVLNHYAVHAGVSFNDLQPGVNRFILEMCTTGALGVIIFVLITGYYLGRSQKPLKPRKLVNMIALVTFYSGGLYLLMCAVGHTEFSLRAFIYTFLPMLFNQYWFATAYVLLYLFHPYINRLLANLNRKEELRFILIGFACFSVFQLLTHEDLFGNELVLFALYYVIGDYLGRYPDNIFAKRKTRLLVIAVSVLAIASFTLLYDFAGLRLPYPGVEATYLLRNRISPFTIGLAVAIFSYFANKKESYNPIINAVAGTTFGIYLIHDHGFVRHYLWQDIFHNAEVFDSKYMVVHMVFAVGATFVVCMTFELVRGLVVRGGARYFRSLRMKK